MDRWTFMMDRCTCIMDRCSFMTFKTETTIYSQYKAWKGQDIV